MVFSVGISGGGGFSDPPLTDTIESRLTGLIWVNDDALGGGYIGNYDIHVIDAIIWALGRRPVSAYAKGGRFRKEPARRCLRHQLRHLHASTTAWPGIIRRAVGPTHDWLKQGRSKARSRAAPVRSAGLLGKGLPPRRPKTLRRRTGRQSLRRRRQAQHRDLLRQGAGRRLRQRNGPAFRRLHPHLHPRP